MKERGGRKKSIKRGDWTALKQKMGRPSHKRSTVFVLRMIAVHG